MKISSAISNYSHKQASNHSEKISRPFFKSAIQPKLTINQSNDTYEKEADAIAERVMRMPVTKTEPLFFQPQPVLPITLVQRKCAHCEEEEKVQMKGEPATSGGMTAPSIVHDTINSGGQPLESVTRSAMESRFGYDFGNVQIHNDSLAHQSSAAINAMAYTHGNHVVFGSGQYQPDANSGKQLLAHELAHVVQQNDIVHRKPGFNGVCLDFHRCNVIEPMKVAVNMVDKAIGALKPVASGKQKSGHTVDLLNFHFKIGAVVDAGKILSNYQKIKAELNSPIKYNCYTNDPPICTAQQYTGAATSCAIGDEIDLCNLYFVTGCTDRAKNLIHENAHHLGFCTDPAYLSSAAYATMTHSDAMINADSYAHFAKEVLGGKPSCVDCSYAIFQGKKY